DHASASRFGYPGAMSTSGFSASPSPNEPATESSPYATAHDATDTVRETDVRSILTHAKLAFVFAYELSRFPDVPARPMRRERKMSCGDGAYGYALRWSAARGADPFGVLLWVAVVVAVACYMRVWRELAVLGGLFRKGVRSFAALVRRLVVARGGRRKRG